MGVAHGRAVFLALGLVRNPKPYRRHPERLHAERAGLVENVKHRVPGLNSNLTLLLRCLTVLKCLSEHLLGDGQAHNGRCHAAEHSKAPILGASHQPPQPFPTSPGQIVSGAGPLFVASA